MLAVLSQFGWALNNSSIVICLAAGVQGSEQAEVSCLAIASWVLCSNMYYILGLLHTPGPADVARPI